MKVLTILGTRPEIIRLSRVIHKLDQYTNHTLVHTGQNYDYELNKIFFEDLQIRKPDYFLEAALPTAGATIGNVIIKVDELLEKLQPDSLLVLGDTNSSLAVIPAKRRKIVVFHMEAGNRCFDQRVPEEINRKIVDHTSDVNLTYSTIAREYLLREGFPADQIIKTGSPMYEVLYYYRNKIDQSSILNELDLASQGYFVVSCHREENVDAEFRLRKVADILDEICKEYEMPVIFSTHPRTKKKLEQYDIELNPLVRIMKPFSFFDYIHLQLYAYCTISDSGTITEEASILNFPAINFRDVHERPEGMEEGVAILSGLSVKRVLDSIPVATSMKRNPLRNIELVKDYHAPNVSDKVLKLILSYTDYVKRRVWGLYDG